MALTPKENYLNALRHKEIERVPVFITDCAAVGFAAGPGPWIEKGPFGGGYDGFGVRWIPTASGGGSPIPAPNEYILDSDTVTNWRNIVKFPDLDAVDWDEEARKEFEMFNVDPENQAVDFGCGNGVFERLAALMGFEEALIAMLEEPEACDELFGAITDYKIELAKRVKKAYKADIFTNYDDIATERGLFMSPETYRKLIKPHHKRLHEAVIELGMIPIQHTCGYCEDIVEDMIETKAAAWTSVQPTNDIAKLQDKYGDRFVFEGGYNSNGPPALIEATTEERIAEVHRCFETYGRKPGYIFFGFVIAPSLNPADQMAIMGPMLQEAMKCSHQYGPPSK